MAGVPSTTATSLTSLGTALTPGQHGLVGYTSRVPGTDRLLNALLWDKQVDPLEWQPHPTGFARLARGGRAHHRGEQAGVRGLRADPRAASAARSSSAATRSASGSPASSRRPRRTPRVTYVYDGDLDWTGHRYGVDSPQWRAQLAAIDASVEQLREALDPGVRLRRGGRPRDGRQPAGGADRRRRAPRAARRRAAARGRGAVPAPLLRRGGAVDGRGGDLARAARRAGRGAAAATRRSTGAGSAPVDAAVRPRLGDVVVAAHGDLAVMSTGRLPLREHPGRPARLADPGEMEIPILVC